MVRKHRQNWTGYGRARKIGYGKEGRADRVRMKGWKRDTDTGHCEADILKRWERGGGAVRPDRGGGAVRPDRGACLLFYIR